MSAAGNEINTLSHIGKETVNQPDQITQIWLVPKLIYTILHGDGNAFSILGRTLLVYIYHPKQKIIYKIFIFGVGWDRVCSVHTIYCFCFIVIFMLSFSPVLVSLRVPHLWSVFSSWPALRGCIH